MSNPYFNWTFDVAPGSTNRSKPVENEFAAIGTGFDGVAAVLQRALRAPTGEVLADMPNKATRQNKSLACDANGDVIAVVAATSVEMQAAITAATGVNDAAVAAAASAATVAQSASYIQQLMLAQGVR